MKDKTENPTEKLLEEFEVKETLIVNKARKKTSISYTVMQYENNAQKLIELGLINENEFEKLMELKLEILKRWTKK